MTRTTRLATALFLATGTVAAQQPTAAGPSLGVVRSAGRVVRLDGRDTVAVPGVRVVLHRIGREVQGPVDSVMADGAGRFRFGFPRDTTALHLVSARYAGIEYFSAPIAINPARPDTGLVLLVSDTSTTTPIALDGRNIVVSKAGQDGVRRVLELLVLRNGGDRARVAPDTIRPSWAMPLPKGVVGFDVGPGDISSDAVIARNDSVLVFAPLSPGDKQLVFEYALPGDRTRVELPIADGVRSLNLLVEDPALEFDGLALEGGTTDTVQGKPYRRFSGEAAAGSVLTLRWRDPREGSRRLLAALVGGVALVVAGMTVWVLRGRRPREPRPVVAAAPPAESPATMLDRIAALDARYAGREADVPPDEWAQYRATRERLVAAALGAPASGD
jgi:hypothetical protein